MFTDRIVAGILASFLVLFVSTFNFSAYASAGTIEGKILFTASPVDPVTKMRSGESDIYVADADGKDRRKLTAGSGMNYSDPVWSPDGSQIAFAAGGNIYVADANAKGKKSITDESIINSRSTVGFSHPSWSADGSRIIFHGTKLHNYRRTCDKTGCDESWAGIDQEIYSINIDGTDFRNLTNSDSVNEVDPAVSPDGRYLAYSVLDTGEVARSLRVLDTSLRFGQEKILWATTLDSIGSYTWNAGSSRLLVTLNAESNNPELYSVNLQGSNTFIGSPMASGAWSPDQSKIVFSNFAGTGSDSDLVVANSDPHGASQTNITNTPTVFEDEPQWHPQSHSSKTEEPSQEVNSPNLGQPASNEPAKQAPYLQLTALSVSKTFMKVKLTCSAIPDGAKTDCSDKLIIKGTLPHQRKTPVRKAVQILLAQTPVSVASNSSKTFTLQGKTKALQRLFAYAKRYKQHKIVVTASLQQNKSAKPISKAIQKPKR